MKFIYLEEDQDRQYHFTFDNEIYYNSPGPGFWREMLLEVEIISTKTKIHKDYIIIKDKDAKLCWQEHHIRFLDPLISETARKKAQQLLDNKVFW